MSKEEFQYIYDNKAYRVVITYKGYRQKNIYFRKNGDVLNVSAGSVRHKKQILDSLPTMIEKMNKKAAKKNSKYFDEQGVFILGEYQKFNDDRFVIQGRSYLFLDEKQFYNRVKSQFEQILRARVDYYSEIMGIKNQYKINVKQVKTIYGSNSIATKSLTFNAMLIHFSIPIIDSVVVHELAHDFVRNHSKKFYNVVLKTMPDYFERDAKLRKGIFQ